eukprot:scaffold119444_cov60-Phaeocystis_antarctica.AAC.2
MGGRQLGRRPRKGSENLRRRVAAAAGGGTAGDTGGVPATAGDRTGSTDDEVGGSGGWWRAGGCVTKGAAFLPPGPTRLAIEAFHACRIRSTTGSAGLSLCAVLLRRPRSDGLA